MDEEGGKKGREWRGRRAKDGGEKMGEWREKGERMEGKRRENGGKMEDDGGSYRLQLIRGFALTVFMR